MRIRKRQSGNRIRALRKQIEWTTAMTLCAAILVIVLVSSYYWGQGKLRAALLNGPDAQRLDDLRTVAAALELFRRDHGRYPPSKHWDGVSSCWGRSSADWIAGLAPAYLSELPRDPRNDENCWHGYNYRSDGKRFKLLAHAPVDCARVAREVPGLEDPVRRCNAYSVWSDEVSRTW